MEDPLNLRRLFEGLGYEVEELGEVKRHTIVLLRDAQGQRLVGKVSSSPEISLKTRKDAIFNDAVRRWLTKQGVRWLQVPEVLNQGMYGSLFWYIMPWYSKTNCGGEEVEDNLDLLVSALALIGSIPSVVLSIDPPLADSAGKIFLSAKGWVRTLHGRMATHAVDVDLEGMLRRVEPILSYSGPFVVGHGDVSPWQYAFLDDEHGRYMLLLDAEGASIGQALGYDAVLAAQRLASGQHVAVAMELLRRYRESELVQQRDPEWTAYTWLMPLRALGALHDVPYTLETGFKTDELAAVLQFAAEALK